MLLRFLGVLTWASLGAGCSYAPPQLSVSGARITEETSEGIVVRFELDALNPNSVELPLREVRYTLTIDGRQVFTGLRSPEASLRRLGTQQVSFPAVIPLDPAAARPTGEVAYSIEGSLAYTTPGELAQTLFDIRVRRPSVPFHQSGTIDLTPAK